MNQLKHYAEDHTLTVYSTEHNNAIAGPMQILTAVVDHESRSLVIGTDMVTERGDLKYTEFFHAMVAKAKRVIAAFGKKTYPRYKIDTRVSSDGENEWSDLVIRDTLRDHRHDFVTVAVILDQDNDTEPQHAAEMLVKIANAKAIEMELDVPGSTQR